VANVHREPDTVLILTALFFGVAAYKIIVAAYSLHFVSNHQVRTEHNWGHLKASLKKSSTCHAAVSVGIYGVLAFIQSLYESKIGTLAEDIVDYIKHAQWVMLG